MNDITWCRAKIPPNLSIKLVRSLISLEKTVMSRSHLFEETLLLHSAVKAIDLQQNIIYSRPSFIFD